MSKICKTLVYIICQKYEKTTQVDIFRKKRQSTQYVENIL